MSGNLLTTSAQIMCPHGGTAVLSTSNARVSAGAPVLLLSDVHSVVGCPFTLPGGKYSPCVRVEWTTAAVRATVGGTPPVTEGSVGLCIGPEGAPQGTAVILTTQPQTSTQ